MNHPMRRKTDASDRSAAPRAVFSRELERTARTQAWDDIWGNSKTMVLAYYLIDIGGALLRSLLHVILWVPSIVLWPLLLSSNGVVKQEVLDWVVAVGGGGWEGALWKLVGAVFLISLTTQLMRGSVGERLRRHMDRSMERSLIWNMIETQLPLSHRADPSSPPSSDQKPEA